MRYEVSDQIKVHILSSHSNSPPKDIPSSIAHIMEQQQKSVESFAVRCASPDLVDEALGQLHASKMPFKRCTILDAFSSPSTLVQTVAAKLCDAGCTHLILAEESTSKNKDSMEKRRTSSPAQVDVDPDDVREAVEAVLWSDVVGTPMSERVGLRPGCTDWRDQVAEALALNLKHFDASLDGVAAPLWEELVEEFDSRDLQHNLKSTG